jgi:hypothetical protein
LAVRDYYLEVLLDDGIKTAGPFDLRHLPVFSFLLQRRHVQAFYRITVADDGLGWCVDLLQLLRGHAAATQR